MNEAFDFVGIGEKEMIDAEAVQGKMNSLPKDAAEFIDSQIRSFLQCYGRRRNMSAEGGERTRFVLSRLTERPVYYIKVKN